MAKANLNVFIERACIPQQNSCGLACSCCRLDDPVQAIVVSERDRLLSDIQVELKVCRSDEKDVDAVDCCNLLSATNRLVSFDLGYDYRAGGCFGGPESILVSADCSRKSPLSDGRITGRPDDGRCLLC